MYTIEDELNIDGSRHGADGGKHVCVYLDEGKHVTASTDNTLLDLHNSS